MKRILALGLCCSLAFLPGTAPAQEKPKMSSLLEGLCLGLVIGVVADILIIVAVGCYKHSSTNAPPTLPPPPPPQTNSPPVTNTPAISALNAGDAIAWYPSPSADFVLLSATVLQARPVSGEEWRDLYTIMTWHGTNGRATVIAQDGVSLLTNYTESGFVRLPVPLPSNSFFRLKQP